MAHVLEHAQAWCATCNSVLGLQATVSRKLAAYGDYKIHTHPDDTYGVGFHRALMSYELLGGLEKVLEHLRVHMDLPVSAKTVAMAIHD